MDNTNFGTAARAIMAGCASIEQIEYWLEHPYRAVAPDIMETLVRQLLTTTKRSVRIERQVRLLTERMQDKSILLPETVEAVNCLVLALTSPLSDN